MYGGVISCRNITATLSGSLYALVPITCGAESSASVLLKFEQLFTARRNARIASAVLATAIPSVRLSVRLSVCHTPVLRQNYCT